jgi:hypothetical protein
MPVGDLYINQNLWAVADEQVIPAEKRAVMEDNGFRLGQIGGALPPQLQNLVTSKRSCADPRRVQTHSGSTVRIPLGTTMPLCTFGLHDDKKITPVTLEDADCVLAVTPTLTEDGRTRLQFVPEVHHGHSALLAGPAADRSGWELQQQRPTEHYQALAWEVCVNPGEYLVIGARFERGDTLGHRTFLRGQPEPCQRLVVLRAGRLQPRAITGAPIDEQVSANQVPSLARQAGFAAARGAGR